MLIRNEKRRDSLWVSLWLNRRSNNGFNLFQFIFQFMAYLWGEHKEEKCWTYRQKHNSIRQLNQTTHKHNYLLSSKSRSSNSSVWRDPNLFSTASDVVTLPKSISMHISFNVFLLQYNNWKFPNNLAPNEFSNELIYK